MTIYETLKETSINGRYICAERYIDKDSALWNYRVIDIENGCAIVKNSDITKCAKTTWRKRFSDAVAYHSGR